MHFYTAEPSPTTAWRLAVLMGVNTRTYKFALAESLLSLARQGHSEVRTADLAAPYAMALLRHLEMPQATQSAAALGDSDFLTVAEAEAAASVATGVPSERLVDAAAKSMPGMVMQKFHNLRGGVEVPHRFYELTGKSSDRVVTFTSALAQLATSEQATSLGGEIDARCASWSHRLPQESAAASFMRASSWTCPAWCSPTEEDDDRWRVSPRQWSAFSTAGA